MNDRPDARPSDGDAAGRAPVMGLLERRLAVLALVAAGLCFLLYPAVYPFVADTGTLEEAEAYGSTAWVLAHSFAIAGFILLSLGLFALHAQLRGTARGRLSLVAVVVAWTGAGLTLVAYGAETFGLYVIGAEVVATGDLALLDLADDVRSGGMLWFLGGGLLLMALGLILLSVVVWRGSLAPRWAPHPLALGFVLFIPQFFAPGPVRIAHGVVMLLGCFLLAWWLARRPARDERRFHRCRCVRDAC